MKDYLLIIFGPSAIPMVPLAFLAVSAILNVVLDLVCVLVLDWGVKGAAIATVFSQFVSGVGIGLYTLQSSSRSSAPAEDCKWDKHNLGTILNLSVMTSVPASGSVCPSAGHWQMPSALGII